MRIGIVGTGKMGSPIFHGAIREFGKENVTFLSKRKEHMQKLTAQTQILPAASLLELVTKSDMIVLAVKPQHIWELYPDIKLTMTQDKIIVSVMAGVDITELRARTGAKKIVRTMPNLPAMLGDGMTCISFAEDALNESEKAVVRRLFLSVGRVEELPEKLMNAAVCANGSSPAFAFMFMEALADAVVKYGISRDMAYRLVAQTMLGSAKMLLETGRHPGELKDDVCSPGGTTIEGVAALEEYGLRNAIIKAADACYQKAADMVHTK